MRLLRKAAFVGHQRLLKRGLSRHSRYSESVIPPSKLSICGKAAGCLPKELFANIVRESMKSISFAGMQDSGVIAPYVSPEATQLRPNMRDPAGWWVAYFGNIQAIICNRARVKSAPNDWKDFLDPKWKGEFSIDDTRYEWFYALQQIYGREEANKMISGFRQNGVNLRRGGTLRAQLVGAGEESCGLGVYLNNVRDLLEQNAPVTYSVPEPVIVVPVINLMAKLPPHPYAAILLYDFILTPGATGQYTRANAMAPARDNLPLVKEVMELQGKRTYVVDVEASSRDYEKTVKEYNSLLKQ